MRNCSLFDLRDHPIPSVTQFTNEVKSGIKECMHDVLQLCEQLGADSVEMLSMRVGGGGGGEKFNQ